jgi:hypothetical protein
MIFSWQYDKVVNVDTGEKQHGEMLILAYILLIEVSTSLKHQTNFLMACTKF